MADDETDSVTAAGVTADRWLIFRRESGERFGSILREDERGFLVQLSDGEQLKVERSPRSQRVVGEHSLDLRYLRDPGSLVAEIEHGRS